MSTDSPGRHPDDVHESPDPDGLADVFNRFSFDSDRRAHRHRRYGRSPRHGTDSASERTDTHDAQWPASDTDLPTQQTSTDAVAAGDRLETGQMSRSQQPLEDEQPATYIRPYAWTGGRTKSNQRLELETLVSTSEVCHTVRLQRLEHQNIADLCRHPRSVAEVGALLGVPLGVAKVLLGDMADLGLITVHHTVTENGSTSHLDLMERVLSGLRRL